MIAPHDAHDRGVLAVRIVRGLLRGAVEQVGELRAGEALVGELVERRGDLPASVGAARGHHRLAVPAEQGLGGVQVGEHGELLAQLAHGAAARLSLG